MTLKELKKTISTLPIPEHWLRQWLLFVLDKPASFLIAYPDYQLLEYQLERFWSGVERMREGVPLEYLTGVAHFWSLSFFVNEHTLIPRPDTERLVETALTHIKNCQQPQPINILELGTGSGCIAISLHHSLQALGIAHRITASDKSKQALSLAKKNAENLKAEIAFVESDWFSNIKGKFDVIISNPPYIAKDDPHLQTLRAEPITALISDNNGLKDLEHIIAHSKTHLTNKGMVFVEHGYNQKDALKKYFFDYGFSQINTIKDYGGNDRVSYAKLDL